MLHLVLHANCKSNKVHRMNISESKMERSFLENQLGFNMTYLFVLDHAILKVEF